MLQAEESKQASGGQVSKYEQHRDSPAGKMEDHQGFLGWGRRRMAGTEDDSWTLVLISERTWSLEQLIRELRIGFATKTAWTWTWRRSFISWRALGEDGSYHWYT